MRGSGSDGWRDDVVDSGARGTLLLLLLLCVSRVHRCARPFDLYRQLQQPRSFTARTDRRLHGARVDRTFDVQVYHL